MNRVGLVFDEEHFDRAERSFREKLPLVMDTVIRRAAFRIIGGVARRWPVDTGRSRAAWRAALKELRPRAAQGLVEIVVLNPVEYTPYLEYGAADREGLGILQSEMRAARNEVGRLTTRLITQAWRAS